MRIPGTDMSFFRARPIRAPTWREIMTLVCMVFADLDHHFGKTLRKHVKQGRNLVHGHMHATRPRATLSCATPGPDKHSSGFISFLSFPLMSPLFFENRKNPMSQNSHS